VKYAHLTLSVENKSKKFLLQNLRELIYSACVDDRATARCLEDFHEIKLEP